MPKIKLNDWFEIDEQEYLMYILKGYNIVATRRRVGWLLNGHYHREDGPAVISVNGYKAWLLNGKRHREDGPAIIWADGARRWYLNGILYTEDYYIEEVKKYVEN